MITSDREMLRQVRYATGASEGEYDDEAIVRRLVAEYGLVDIDDIDDDAFWSIVLEHEVSARG